MKSVLALLATGAFLLSVVVFTAPASAAPMFDDPQLCVNGKLLRVEPTTAPIDVFVQVGSNLTVDYVVENCGGDPNLPVVDAAQVEVGGHPNWMKVHVKTEPKTKVIFVFDGHTKIDKSNNAGWADFKVKFKSK
jgi:hypothetical protein